jgi:fumarylacetoacetate (FAA) hydrolase family protein
MTSSFSLDPASTLPKDGLAGTLVGRAWLPATSAMPASVAVVALRADGVFDISSIAPTISDLVELEDPAAAVQAAGGRRIGSLDELLENSVAAARTASRPYFLAPCDLQVIKAAGVTFAASLLERVIEERAKGDPQGAAQVREQVQSLVGDSLANIRPGSPEADRLKALLVEQGMWSQYLEVGIGPDAEIFTKGPLLSAVGTGAEIGLHPDSVWNNPEPEVVLSVDSRGRVLGAMLGNDVNLRDFEGRSALLLSKAKDNNGSTSIGPFLRLFDASFSIDDVRRAVLDLRVDGPDGYVLHGTSSMDQIARDPLDLVAQTIGPNHQYPDGFVLFLGTLFAPIEDRNTPGGGFTHSYGDLVTISSEKLGTLINQVNRSDRIEPWTIGVRSLFASLAARGLVKGAG